MSKPQLSLLSVTSNLSNPTVRLGKQWMETTGRPALLRLCAMNVQRTLPPSKMGGLALQPLSSSTLMHQDVNKRAIRWSLSATTQVGSDMQFICDDTDKLAKITNLLPSAYTQIHINYFQIAERTWDIKQKARNSSTNSDKAPSYGNCNCKVI